MNLLFVSRPTGITKAQTPQNTNELKNNLKPFSTKGLNKPLFITLFYLILIRSL